MNLSARISEAIAGSKKKKAQIARECEVSSGAVSQWLSGETKSLKGETAVLLEEATNYRAYWLLYGKGPKKRGDPVTIWPFPKIDLARYEALDEGDKGYVERTFIKAVEECEGTSPQGPRPTRIREREPADPNGVTRVYPYARLSNARHAQSLPFKGIPWPQY